MLAMPGALPYEFHGYAIISDDDRIADARGRFPDCLKNEADWTYFQAGLDDAGATLLGRRSHEASPNPKGRLRLVVSRSAAGLERRCDGWWWNPEGVSLADALDGVAPRNRVVAVPGGRDVFDLIGASGFAAFHLARAHGRSLPGGTGLFRACEAGARAEGILAAGGLCPSATTWLDEANAVSLTVWRAGGR